MGWKSVNFRRSLNTQEQILGTKLAILGAGAQCCLLLQSHCGKILAPWREECSQTNLVAIKNQNDASMTMKGKALSSLFQFKNTCPCGRQFQFCLVGCKSSSCGTKQKILNYAFWPIICTLLGRCLDFLVKVLDDQGEKVIGVHPSNRAWESLCASSVVCPSFTFYSPHSLEENLATFFAVFRDMRGIPQFSPLIQCGTLSTHRVFKGEPGFTAVSKICIYTGRNDWITWDENLFGNPHEGADYFWQV